MELTELKGVGDVTEKKLKDAQIFTVEDLLIIPPAEVSEKTGMDSETVLGLFTKARNKIRADSLTFRKASEDSNELKVKFSTGTEAFDKLLGGGLETGSTTETYGEFGSGKSQFSFTMAVRVQLPIQMKCLQCNTIYESDDIECKECKIGEKPVQLVNVGGLGKKAIWIDSEGTFSKKRIIEIAVSMGYDPDVALDNIIVANAHNSVEQQMILDEASQLIEKENIGLVVIDSTTGLFRAEYLGRGTLSERQGKISRFVNRASSIARTKKVAFILTNQVMSSPGVMYGDPTRPIGGNIVAHNSTYRIYFRKSGAYRVAKMVDSPEHPEMEVVFGLSVAGVVDKAVREAEVKAAEKEKKKSAKSTKNVDSEEEE